MTMDSSTRSGRIPSPGSGDDAADRAGHGTSPRSRCEDFDTLFAAYVDDEAAPRDRSAVEAHLTACPPCRDRLAGERTARAVVHARRDNLRPCASDALRTRCAGLRPAVSRASVAAAASRRWVPLSLAATLVLAIAGVFLFGLSDRVDAFAAQVALDHAKCFKFSSDRVTTGDPALLGRDWTSKQGWALKVPSSAPAHDLELLGVRRCGSTEGRVAHMMYRWRGEPLSVYVLPAAIAPERDVQNVVDRLGHEAVIWSNSGRTYAIVVRRPPGDLAEVVAYVKTTAR